jgi:hypothetical protein
MFTQLRSMHNFDFNEHSLRWLKLQKFVFRTVSFFLHECTYYNTETGISAVNKTQ